MGGDISELFVIWRWRGFENCYGGCDTRKLIWNVRELCRNQLFDEDRLQIVVGKSEVFVGSVLECETCRAVFLGSKFSEGIDDGLRHPWNNSKIASYQLFSSREAEKLVGSL